MNQEPPTFMEEKMSEEFIIFINEIYQRPEREMIDGTV